MPLVTTNEFNEDTRGKYDTVEESQNSTMPQFPNYHLFSMLITSAP